MTILQDHKDGSATIWGEFDKAHEGMVVRYFMGHDRPEEFYVICEAGKVPLVEYADRNGITR